MRLAVELGMPLFLHEREAATHARASGSAADLLAILDEERAPPASVCIHCFTSSAEVPCGENDSEGLSNRQRSSKGAKQIALDRSLQPC